MIEHHLQLAPGQTELTPEQQAEAQHFAAERIATQLSTAPVDEQEAETWLRQTYQVAGLEPPSTTLWLDGPLDLVGLFVPSSVEARVDARAWARLIAGVGENVGEYIWASAWKRVGADVAFRLQGSVRRAVGSRIEANVETPVYRLARTRIEASVEADVWSRVSTSARPKVKAGLWEGIRASVAASISASVRAYAVAPALGVFRFLDEYLAPNNARALAQFNEGVSGYWLGKDLALIVRRPTRLVCDSAGRLHSATGPCMQYRDGWGFYAWHGISVPEQVILAPEQLTQVDWSKAENVEVRRVIQERMGERFVRELGGVVIDTSSQGTLYEVVLLDDPEQVARYVQVQDASTARQYVLRVPPTVQTAAAAVAWSFQMAVEEYHPAHET